ncbi:DNA gyrase inhibitor YacG [Planctomycetes bacterium K23_9]
MPMKCSTCGLDFLLDETEAPPFCSQRCRMIDLGRWLDEEIGVPHEGGPEPGKMNHSIDDDEEAQDA